MSPGRALEQRGWDNTTEGLRCGCDSSAPSSFWLADSAAEVSDSAFRPDSCGLAVSAARGGGEWSRSSPDSAGACAGASAGRCCGSGAAERSPSPSRGTALKPPRGENGSGSNGRSIKLWHGSRVSDGGFFIHPVLPVSFPPGRFIPGAGAVVVVVPAQIKHLCKMVLPSVFTSAFPVQRSAVFKFDTFRLFW